MLFAGIPVELTDSSLETIEIRKVLEGDMVFHFDNDPDGEVDVSGHLYWRNDGKSVALLCDTAVCSNV